MSVYLWRGSAATHLASRADFVHRWLLWLQPKTFAGVVTPIGLWTGETDETIPVNEGTTLAASRLYYGAQGGMQVPAIHYSVGTQVSDLSLSLSLTPEGEAFARTYDTRLAPAELHNALYHPITGALLGTRRYWQGLIDDVSIDTGAQDDVSKISLSVVTSARLGTLSTAGKKSHQSHLMAEPGDNMRQYGDFGTRPDDPWAFIDD